ncbi:MAG: uroporphyrinogen-III synthase, partial [Acetobacteraceae bacterium]
MTRSRDAVLITRPQAGSEMIAIQVAKLGLQPVVAPLSEIRDLTPALPDSAAAVLLTSGNAAAAVPAWAHGLPVFAVGDATAERARAAGCANVHSARGDAGDLARLVGAALPPRAGLLLLLCGRCQGSALMAALQGAGYTVLRRA